jgi:hypothetical protein
MKSAVSVLLITVWAISVQAQTQPTPLRDAASREAAQLAAVGFAPPQAPQGPQRSWPARHPVLTGTLVGLGVGFPIGAATCKAPGVEGPCSYYTYPGNARFFGGVTIGLIGAGVGAGVGAVIGAIVR